MVAPAGNGVALQRRLRAHVLLEGIEAVQGVAGADLVQNVAGVLVDLHRSGRKRNVVVVPLFGSGMSAASAAAMGSAVLLAAIAV